MFGFYRCFFSPTRWIFSPYSQPPPKVKNSMFSLVPIPKILSWFADHRGISMAILFIALTLVVLYWIDWFVNHGWIFYMAILLIVFTLAGFYWLVGTHIKLSWFGDRRSIWMTYPFFAFTAAGFVSLAGTHSCRKALWDSRTVTTEDKFTDMGKYKQLFWLRVGVWLFYGSATIDFFIIASLSIPL
jgi:hypothetical protein